MKDEGNSALLDHIEAQAARATLLSRIADLLNVVIDHPDQRCLCVQLVEAAQGIASDLANGLQDMNLPQGGGA